MSLKEKYNLPKIDKKKLEEFQKFFHPILSKILIARNFKNPKEAENFIEIKWENNFDPFLFKDMGKAVKRIFQAIRQNEKILIFSDYDADGIPGAVALSEFFQKINYQNFEIYIPDRNKDGFGLNSKVIEKIKKENFKLVITIDCGTNDFFEAQELQKNNVDLIITDHHKDGENTAPAFAIINHQIDGEKYPEKVLSGAGVVFKLIQGLIKYGKENKIKNLENLKEGWEKWLLDLIGIATICDMVPLKGENRIFAHYGKLVLQKTFRNGILKILNDSKLEQEKISCQDIAFSIGPKINAAGRLDDPLIAFKALSRGKEAIDYAWNLEKINQKRKTKISGIMRKVYNRLDKRSEINSVIVIGDKDWNLGILGLIASKIVEKYKKPAFVWTELEKGKIKGSVRGNDEVSVYDLMEKTKNFFVSFGGHLNAGGFETDFQKIHKLEEELSKNYSFAEKILKEKILIDAQIEIDDLNQELFDEIKKLSPFGMSNPAPLFLIENLGIQKINFFGRNKEHLEIIFEKNDGEKIKAISFFYQEKLPNFDKKENEKISIIFNLEKNYFNGKDELRMRIVDIF